MLAYIDKVFANDSMVPVICIRAYFEKNGFFGKDLDNNWQMVLEYYIWGGVNMINFDGNEEASF